MTRKESAIAGIGIFLVLAGLALNPSTASFLLGRNILRPEHRLLIYAMGLALILPGLLLVLRRRSLELAGVMLAMASFAFCGVLLFSIDLWLGGVTIDRDLAFIENVHMADARLGWKPKPGVGRHYHKGLFDVRYSIDSDGLRTMPKVSRPVSNTYFFGDSFTFGHGVADDATYAYLIAKRYSSKGIAMHNAGVMGYGMTQIYLRFLELESRLGPGDLVVLAPLSEDLSRSYETLAQRTRLLNVLHSEGGARAEDKRFYPDYRDGTIEFREIPRASNLLERLQERALNAPFSGALIRALSGASAGRRRAVAASHDMLRAMAEKTASHGARFVLMFLPRTDECAARTYMQDISGFEYLDLLRYFPTAREMLDPLVFKGDGHWNEAGHRMAAEAVASALTAAGVLPATDAGGAMSHAQTHRSRSPH